jgi:CRISPR-associated exonuclease Cas4
MTTYYNDDDLLLLSGIQHIAFCERQWALIHIEQQWAENILTVEGKHVHTRADNPFVNESRENIKVTRSVSVISRELGLQGVVDVVEYIRDDDAPLTETISLKNKPGKWRVSPVEYKRGKPKKDDRDIVQLCAQAIALEEMLSISIKIAYIYYNQIRRREQVLLDDNLRDRVINLSLKMHEMYNSSITPPAQKEKHCLKCSLYEICQPDWNKPKDSVKKYLYEELSNDEWGEI